MLTEAVRDLIEGAKQHEIWSRLGWVEIQRRYRRTAIGPFWTTISVGMFIFALGYLWANLWGVPSNDFLPYLTCGMVAWSLIGGLITEGCATFVGSQSLLLSVRIPLTVLALTVVWRNFIVLLHNLVLVLIVLVVFQSDVNLKMMLFFPALLLVFFNGLWVATLLGGVCCRFRDVQQLIVSLLGIMMFCTPVLWSVDRLPPEAHFWIQFNVFFHFVEIMRAPLLGKAPALLSWGVVFAWGVFGWTITLMFMSRFRRRIPFWL